MTDVDGTVDDAGELAPTAVAVLTHIVKSIVDDPDAPDPARPKMTWVHWVLYDLPPSATGLDEDVAPSGLPAGTRQGINDWKRPNYGGPCPPIGRHRYFFKLYALDTVLDLAFGAGVQQLVQAMQGHILGQTELMGTYSR